MPRKPRAPDRVAAGRGDSGGHPDPQFGVFGGDALRHRLRPEDSGPLHADRPVAGGGVVGGGGRSAAGVGGGVAGVNAADDGGEAGGRLLGGGGGGRESEASQVHGTRGRSAGLRSAFRRRHLSGHRHIPEGKTQTFTLRQWQYQSPDC